MISLFATLLRKKQKPQIFKVDTKAPTIPESFGYPLASYELLVNELAAFVRFEDKLVSFNQYITQPNFAKFNLDLQNPSHTAILGYAFCAAIMIQRETYKQEAINQVLNAFVPRKEVN